MRDLVIYWDMAALWNFILDYLLLLGTLRVAGRPLRRRRLALGAIFGAGYSVAALAFLLPAWTALPALPVMTRIAFGRTERYGKLTLLFALFSCGLGGAVLLLGRLGGDMEHLAYGLVCARLPWGVFFAASGLSYLLLTLVFRGGAKYDGAAYVPATIEYGGKRVSLRLFRDTGKSLTDPLTGEGVPVIEKSALAPLFSEGNDGTAAYMAFATLNAHTALAGEGTLQAFRCDNLTVGGRNLGARLIALAPEPFGGAYQGLWLDEEVEETERNELEATVG